VVYPGIAVGLRLATEHIGYTHGGGQMEFVILLVFFIAMLIAIPLWWYEKCPHCSKRSEKEVQRCPHCKRLKWRLRDYW